MNDVGATRPQMHWPSLTVLNALRW